MALYQLFAEEVLKKHEKDLLKLPEAKRNAIRQGVIIGIKNKPEYAIDETQISPETLSKLSRSKKVISEDAYQPKGITANATSMFNDAKRRAELEAQGVSLDEDVPFEGSWKLGFGVDSQKELGNALSKHYGQEVKMVKDKDDFIYMNPETKKLTRANLGAVAELGRGMPMAGDVAGTVATMHPLLRGGGAMTQVAKESAGAGIGTTIGEYARLTIGKLLGVHDLGFDEISKRATMEGAEAAAITGGIGTGITAVKGVNNFIKGGIFNLDEAKKFGLNADEANEVIAEVNKINKMAGKDNELKTTLYQKTGDVKLGSLEGEIRASEEHGAEFAARTAQDQAALAEAAKSVTQRPQLVEQGVTSVGDLAKQRVKKRVGQATQIVAKNVDELSRQMDEIGKIQKEAVGEPTADYLKLKHDAAKQSYKQSWDSVAKVGGLDEASRTYGIEIPQGDSAKKLKDQFRRRTSTAQTKIAAGGTGAIFKEPARVKGKIVPQKPQDLYDLNREISDLKRELSNMRIGKARGTTSEKDLAEVVGAMVEDRNSALIKAGRKDLIDAIEVAERETLSFHETYKRSAVGDLMEKSVSGVPVIKSQNFVDDVLKRDTVELENFTDVIADNPELVGQWKEGLADAWKSKAFNEKGKFNADASKRWFKTNEQALEHFFTKAEINGFKKAGKFSEKVAKQTKQLKEFVNKANSKFGSGALAKVDREGLTKFITGKGGSWSRPAGEGVEQRISKIKFVKNMTADHPAAWRTLQNDFKQTIRDDILDNKTGLINPTKIANWTADKGNAEIIHEVLGAGFLKNINSINEASKLVHRKATRLTGGQAAKATVQMVRAGVAPPLTQRGRVLTGALTFKNKEAHRRIADSLLNEKKMQKVAELLKHNPASRVFYEKAASLGFELQDENEEQQNEE